MKWYIGQPIVAIRNSKSGDVVKGKDYVIKAIITPECNCKELGFDIGIKSNSIKSVCADCGLSFFNLSGFLYKGETMFAPLDQDISELTEILKQPLTKTLETK